MTREQQRIYFRFLHAAKKLQSNGLLISITGLKEEDQMFIDAALLEPADGAYCD